MRDLAPATTALATVVEAVRDDQLALLTPCRDTTVEALLDHVEGLTQAFTAAARQDRPPSGDTAPWADAARLRPDWRERIPTLLVDLADAWRSDDAAQGVTRVGGVDLPRPVAGAVVTNEVIVHGWDLATATGQPYRVDPDLIQAALEFVRPAVARAPGGTPGLFGPPVEVRTTPPRWTACWA
jgi:uncharacterized protein (TIGR03086 family)